MLRSLLLFIIFAFTINSTDKEPMKARYERSATYRWLNKKVFENRVLDNMETLDNWTTFTTGAQQLVDARVDAHATKANSIITEMTLNREKSHNNTGQALRMRIPTKLNVPGPKNGRGWATAGVRRNFKGEDWTGSNRISLWVYPNCPGFYVNWLELRLYNDGAEKLPATFAQEGETSFLLRNYEWNHLVWEISNVARDKIKSLEISYYLSGNEPGATDTVTYYLDQLELQSVEPDHIEGWDVWPGRISYSHIGYQNGAVKSAIASGLSANEFSLINQETGETVLTKPIQTEKTHLGTYQVMDFSEVRKNGTYILESGNSQTHPFKIGCNIWRESIIKALNFFYAERCGFAVKGVHGICHRDWLSINGEKKIIINGGWHDAGDLTQGLGNTGEAIYAMFSLAERLNIHHEDPELYARLIDEAKWGLDWILKTSFRDGYRNGGAVSSRKTNGIIGDFDDLTSVARISPIDHFVASAAEAIAYRVLNEQEKDLANYSLEMAEEDWLFAVMGLESMPEDGKKGVFRGSFDSDNVVHEVFSSGILASIDLWKATGKKIYETKATEWAQIILNSQQLTKPEWDVPLTGFFYTSPTKEHVLHYCHRGREQAPILALTQLCQTFPDHPEWMKWYAAVNRHTTYLKNIAKYTKPYYVLPASIYNDQEYLDAPESRQASFKQQVLNGIPLGSGNYLRIFPVWMDYRGHFGTILPQAQALVNSAHLRGDLEAAQLAEHQLEWVIGRNPFSQSTMWGEGYDFTPLYSVLSGPIVGGLPVGIQTKGTADVPYWPVQSTWTYKEIWVHPVIRWIWLMHDLAGPAFLEGIANSDVEFLEKNSSERTIIKPDQTSGRFSANLPEGNYVVRTGNEITSLTFLPGEFYFLNLLPGNSVDLELSAESTGTKEIIVKAIVRGKGSHIFDLRIDNLNVTESRKELVLKTGVDVTIQWHCSLINDDIPWVAVIIPDNNMSGRKEVHGSAWE